MRTSLGFIPSIAARGGREESYKTGETVGDLNKTEIYLVFTDQKTVLLRWWYSPS